MKAKLNLCLESFFHQRAFGVFFVNSFLEWVARAGQEANRMNNKNRQRTKGRRLLGAQVDVPWSVCHFGVHPPALLRNITDTV